MIVDWFYFNDNAKGMTSNSQLVMRLEKISVERLTYFYELIKLDLENLVGLVIFTRKIF
jgi:hypothetical protein